MSMNFELVERMSRWQWHCGFGARAKWVATIADEYADEGDRQGQLSQPVVDALHREGLLAMWVPRSVLGGSELDVVSSLQVIESLSYGDPSTGWVPMAASLAIGTGAAYSKDDGGRRTVRRRAAAGHRRSGHATRAPPCRRDGGFRLSGSWSFASGIKHSTHIHTLGVIEGTGEPRIFVLPVEQATLIDNWDVLGLRGTGSIDYRIDDVFVPEAYTHFAVTRRRSAAASSITIGIIGFAVICHSGWACGIGRRLLDELAEKVRGRRRPRRARSRAARPSTSSTRRPKAPTARRARSSTRPGPT